ncbi:MAG: metallophosphoesterase [Raineya sp.]|nr:metallophosphoesterase [Raineya sp.]MDW8296935.1 metallophosphoesterase [Raineya sp.]
MKIAQITDLHLTANKQLTPDGIDVWGNLRWALETSRGLCADFLVVTGDICLEKGEEAIYQEFKELIDSYGIPYRLIPGNHDSPEMIAKIWNYPLYRIPMPHTFEFQSSVLVPAILHYPECMLYFWDSTYASINLSWFHGLHSQKLNLIFVHHPILRGASKFMDTYYPLQNLSEIYSKQSLCTEKTYFFHGHYHCEAYLQEDNFKIFITPSLYYQIDTHSEKLNKDFSQIGFRWIEVKNDKVISQVVWKVMR